MQSVLPLSRTLLRRNLPSVLSRSSQHSWRDSPFLKTEKLQPESDGSHFGDTAPRTAQEDWAPYVYAHWLGDLGHRVGGDDPSLIHNHRPPQPFWQRIVCHFVSNVFLKVDVSEFKQEVDTVITRVAELAKAGDEEALARCCTPKVAMGFAEKFANNGGPVPIDLLMIMNYKINRVELQTRLTHKDFSSVGYENENLLVRPVWTKFGGITAVVDVPQDMDEAEEMEFLNNTGSLVGRTHNIAARAVEIQVEFQCLEKSKRATLPWVSNRVWRFLCVDNVDFKPDGTMGVISRENWRVSAMECLDLRAD